MTEQEVLTDIFDRFGVEHFVNGRNQHVVLDVEGETYRDKNNYITVDRLSFVFDENGETVGFYISGGRYSGYGKTEREL